MHIQLWNFLYPRLSSMFSSPPTFISGSTPTRTPFQLFNKTTDMNEFWIMKNATITVRIMLLSPLSQQTIEVKTVSVPDTLTFQQLAKQQLFVNTTDDGHYENLVSISVGTKVVFNFDQRIADTAAIQSDMIVYILSIPVREVQCTALPGMILKPYFNRSPRATHQTTNFFVHFQCPRPDRSDRRVSHWEECTHYWQRIPRSYHLEKILRKIGETTNNNCSLYRNGNKILL